MKKIIIILGMLLLLVIFLAPLLLLFLTPPFDGGGGEETPVAQEISGTANVPATVTRWEPLVRKYTKAEGLPESIVPVVLGLIMQESRGTAKDVMQSSESQGKGVGYFNDPETSIKFGMKHFAEVYNQSKGDLKLVLQSYNYGTGFVDYVLPKKYSLELAKQFSIEQAKKNGYTCRAWRSAEEKSRGMCYGDPYYVDHVMRYVNITQTSAGGESGSLAKGSALGDNNYKAIMNEAKRYEGDPYVWAGYTPQMGFDCSGLMQWIYKQANINLPRTAQEQYNFSEKVSQSQAKPGDLVFFTGTYATSNYITHVGVYLGNGRFYNSNGHGIGESGLDETFWKAHFVGFGRVNK